MKKSLVNTGIGTRNFYTGKFKGYRISGRGRRCSQRIEVRDIKDEYGTLVADYILFDNIKCFLDLNLHEGDIVRFCARDFEYQKAIPTYRYGYNNDETYHRLLYPSQVSKLVCPVRSVREVKPSGTCKIQITPTRKIGGY